jgi:hypothetical protein
MLHARATHLHARTHTRTLCIHPCCAAAAAAAAAMYCEICRGKAGVVGGQRTPHTARTHSISGRQLLRMRWSPSSWGPLSSEVWSACADDEEGGGWVGMGGWVWGGSLPGPLASQVRPAKQSRCSDYCFHFPGSMSTVHNQFLN